MRRIFSSALSVVFFSFFLLVLFLSPSQASAETRPDCSTKGVSTGTNNFGTPRVYPTPVNIQVQINSNGSPGLIPTENYHLQVHRQGSTARISGVSDTYSPSDPGRQINANWNLPRPLSPQIYDVSLHNNRMGVGYTGHLGVWGCNLGTITVQSAYTCEFLRVKKENENQAGAMCYADANSCLEAGSGEVTIEAKVINLGSVYQDRVVFRLNGGGHFNHDQTKSFDSALGYHVATYGDNNVGSYRVTISVDPPGGGGTVPVCTGTFNMVDNCTQCQTNPTNIGQPMQSGVGTTPIEPYKICDQIDQSQPYLQDAYINCMDCVEYGGGSEIDPGGIWTAIGCIPRDPTLIVQNLLRVGLGMGGGVALLMGLAAGFLFSTSQGDPKRTGEARELLTAAITGLLFIIFSVVILQFIGYTVLKIPGFGG